MNYYYIFYMCEGVTMYTSAIAWSVGSACVCVWSVWCLRTATE